MFTKQFILRILFEYRMLFLWIGIAIVGFVFAAFVARQNNPQPQQTPPPDTNIYY